MDKHLKLHSLVIFFSEVIGLDIEQYHLGIHKILSVQCRKVYCPLFLPAALPHHLRLMSYTVTGRDLQAKLGKEKLHPVSLSSFHPLQPLPSAVLYKTSTELTNLNALFQKAM